MIRVDLHTHTNHSHGKDSVETMFASALDQELAVYGFSEHSPRPEEYSYPHEYREHLASTFPQYIYSVRKIQGENHPMKVLLGLELDYLPKEPSFMHKAASAWPFDYLIGGIHFLGTWGFDASEEDWKNHSQEKIFELYAHYFSIVESLANSGLVNILAHPDIIKLFTVDTFRTWLSLSSSRAIIYSAFSTLKRNGIAMEISSAGLRKPCKEIYPAPEIMEIAAHLELPVTFASDAHSADMIGWKFKELADYASKYGYRESVFFQNGVMYKQPF